MFFQQGNLPRARTDDKGVHAGGNDHRPKMVGGVRAGFLQVLRPHQTVQVQEEPEARTSLQ